MANKSSSFTEAGANPVTPRRIGERVAIGAFGQQAERDHRVGYQSRRTAIGGDGGGERGVVERRGLEDVENSQLERGLDGARFGVT